VGAAGGILAVANASPNECVEIYDLFRSGKFDEARELQYRLTPFAKGVTTQYGIGGLKTGMDLAGYFGGDPRPPLKPHGPEVKEELKKLLLQLTK
jgi:4-hydroxy-2-oxoglutarate aldolase